jgi:predicted RNase H-like nuclease
LGWTNGATGLALLDATEDSRARFLECCRIEPLNDVLQWIESRTSNEIEDVVIAVDAPLRIANETGMRASEREAHRRYGRFDAGCYPANRRSPCAARTTGFRESLESLGFTAAEGATGTSGRQYFEAFPHIASIEFFALDRIVKYKKGPRAGRASELQRLGQLIAGLEIADLRLPDIPARGPLKPAEDQLDAILCAWCAWHWQRWGRERNRILGDPDEGCIIVPANQ